MTSVGWSGGLGLFPMELSMVFGLAKPPLEEGESGTPLTPDTEGDLECSSDVRWRRGVADV
jgi:hypothetical protein